MNKIERITATINFEKTDRTPVIAQVFAHAAVLSKISIGKYLTNGKTLAECQIKALKYYNYDAVFALFDVNVETEAAGSKLKYNESDYFTINKYAINENTNINNLTIPNPEKDGRMPEILNAAKILRQEVGNEALVVGCALGPFTIASQLIGMEKMLYMAVDNPDNFMKLLNYATKITVSFGIAQINAGVHLPIIFEPAASPAVVPASFYREIIIPKLKKVFSELKKAGAAANWLHTAGPIKSIMQFYPELGIDIANFDYCIDPELVFKYWPELCADGNIKPLSFEEETPEIIHRQSVELINKFNKRGGFILSSGCEIPPYSKKENIKAMVDSTKK